jgi:DNA-binding response OmpR family regulator
MSGIILATRDAEIYSVLEAEITAERIDVFWAMDGQEAWEHAQQSTPDMVILDINLEIYGAFELCGMLRADPDMPPDLAIILLIDGDVNSKQLQKGGFTAIFQKLHVIISLREMMYTNLKPESIPQQLFD